MLSSNVKLKVYVVGHTDNVGGFDSNIKLSSARAASVLTALVSQHGISASRLTAFGAGPVAPIAPNSTDDSRAKNRRVELVQQ
jgi:outer membrane protein OmpA-like peptidoglycan-associated protein